VKCIIVSGSDDALISEREERMGSVESYSSDHYLCDSSSSYGMDRIISTILKCKKTTVCIINGPLIGSVALDFIMSFDYRISTRFSTFSVDPGLGPSTTMLSTTSVTDSKSAQLQSSISSILHSLLDGNSIEASDAKSISLIDELVDDLPTANMVAEKIGIKYKKRRNSSPDMSKLAQYLPDQFLIYRSSQLFEIIRDYPSSSGLLDELRSILSITCQYDLVIESMKSQLRDRLLIPGAHTEDILQMYLRTYKVVARLFCDNPKPLSIFLRVTNHIVEHLQKRADSVKCIVSSILDDHDDQGSFIATPILSEDDDLTPLDGGLDDMWKPPPLETAIDDTMSLLIGVYGGRDFFLSEYKDMLASRLVSAGSYELDRELASLDLMKSKFDEESLGECSIMVKDILESKKIFLNIKNKLISKKIRNLNVLQSVLILSKHFWPKQIVGEGDGGDDGDIEGSASRNKSIDQFKFLPIEIQNCLSEFENFFTSFKPTQRIEWKKEEGVVVASVNIRDKDFEFRVSPLYIEVLSLFQNLAVISSASSSVANTPIVTAAATKMPQSLSTEDIAGQTQIPPEKVKSIINFWVSKGILREIEINKFLINE